MNGSKWAIINVFALIQMVIMNALANILPINGRQTGDISDSLGVLFTPAGYVFSIWGLIYLMLGLWVLRSLFVKKREEIAVIEAIGPFFLINALLNSTWILLFHYGFYPATLAVITLMLVTLIIIYRRITKVEGARNLNRFPFSLYMGWISVATILNVGVAFNGAGYEDGWLLSGTVWTILILIVAVLLATFLMNVLHDRVYPLVFVWALAGIYVERSAEAPAIAAVAIISAFILFALVLAALWKRKSLYPAPEGKSL